MSRIDKAIKEMEELKADCSIDEDFTSVCVVTDCINILKKHKKKKKKKCVWKKHSTEEYTNRHNDNVLLVGHFMFAYCPYCGRKIKFKESE